VTVRIAVAVDANGQWSGYGNPGLTEKETFDVILDDLEPGEARYWVSATLPIPTVPVIAGTLEGE
jgi:hypothetical protein